MRGLLLLLFFQTASAAVHVGGFVDTGFCYETLQSADRNSDNKLSQSEFVVFANALEPGILTTNQYDALPTAYIMAFTATACDCANCCNTIAEIDIPENLEQDISSLYRLCSLTYAAAETTRNSKAPTTAPISPFPTISPTVAPTEPPTRAPTKSPTASPTKRPTRAPSVSPTKAPTVSPTFAPTKAPIVGTLPPVEPTDAPTEPPTSPAPTSSFSIEMSFDIGITREVRESEIRNNLITALHALGIQQNLRQRRRLQTSSTTITEYNPIECPESLDLDSSVDCVNVKATMDFTSAATQPDNLENSILAKLQDTLETLTWSDGRGNPILLLRYLLRGDDSDRLSPAAIAGISMAAIFFAMLPLCYYFIHRARKSHDEIVIDYPTKSEKDAASDAARADGGILAATNLGAAQPDYGKELMASPGDDENDGDDDEATSSNAGSSGWSSSAGISSLNTGSVDEENPHTLAGIGVASALTRNRENLDALIESGNWAAVGTTAALMAAASDSQSDLSGADQNSRELDHLVDAGDWEGVVAAAAKLEASGSSRSNTTAGGGSSSGGTGSGTGSGTRSSSGGAGGSGIYSGNTSEQRNTAEIRSEVEALVRRVVPEEIDNVDEMMKQFKGREEELVETLRTMQERAVAQKARTAGHKAAKKSARQNVQRGVVPGAAGSVVRKVASLEIQSAASGTGGSSQSGAGISPDKTESLDSKRSSRQILEQAIEAGDWDAVGEAAARMSEDGASSVSTGEINRLANANLSVSTSGSRTAELDALIDNADWGGVVAAASRFSELDKAEAEEAEAVREAERWMQIAESTNETDKSASDAAEWAIQRSITQINANNNDSTTDDSQDEV